MTDFDAIATVLRRELLSGLRTTTSFVLLLGAVSIMLLSALVVIVETQANTAFAGSQLQMLYFVQMGLYNMMVYFMTPALAAVSVNSERREESHEFLATCLLPPRSVVLGKYLAVLGRTLLMASALLPFTGLLYFYAGLDPATLYEDGLKLTFSACAGAAIGLGCSARYAAPAAALFATFALQFILFSLPGLLILAAELGVSSLAPIADAFQNWSNFYPVLSEVLYFGATTLLFLLPTLWRADGIFYDAREKATLPARLDRWYRFRPIPDHTNPFRYRDALGSALAIPVVRLGAFGATLVGYSLLLYAVIDLDREALPATYGLERLAMVALLPPLVAVLLVRERDPATLEAYRMTLLGGSDALAGKLLGLARLSLPFWGAMLLCKVVFSGLAITEDSALTGAWTVLEPALFPLHLIMVALAASFGAAGPGKLVPAVLAGYATTALCGFFALFFTVVLVAALTGPFEIEVFGAFLLYYVVSGFSSLIVWGCASAVLSTHWADNYTDRVPEYYQKQQADVQVVDPALSQVLDKKHAGGKHQ